MGWPSCVICASTGHPGPEEELADFETDVLAGFVLGAGLGRVGREHHPQRHQPPGADPGLDRPLWEMQPPDADTYFGKVLRDAKPSTRTGRVAALTVYSQLLSAAQDRAVQPHRPRRGVSAG